MKKVLFFFLFLNKACFSQTQITDFKTKESYSPYISIVGKFGNKIVYTQQTSIESSVWMNDIGDSTITKIGEFPDINYSINSLSFNGKPYFNINKYPENSELWTCDTTVGSLRLLFKFDQQVSIFQFKDYFLAKGPTQLLTIKQDINKVETEVLIDTLSTINIIDKEFIVAIDNGFQRAKVIVVDSLLNKQVFDLQKDGLSIIEDVNLLEKNILVRARDGNNRIDWHLYNSTGELLIFRLNQIENKIFQKFYYSNDTLNLVEIYGTEKNQDYTFTRSEIIDGEIKIKITSKITGSLGVNYFSFIPYSNAKIVDDELFFICYIPDTNKLRTRNKFLIKLDLNNGNLDRYPVNEVSKTPYYGGYEYMETFTIQKEEHILKIYPNSPFGPAMGFDLVNNKILKFDTLSQKPRSSLSISQNQFVYTYGNELVFLDTLKKSTRIVKPIKPAYYQSNILTSQLVDDNLFLFVREAQNRHSIHVFDGKNLINKFLITDSLSYISNVLVSQKLFNSSYLIIVNYDSQVNLYVYNTITRNVRFIKKQLINYFVAHQSEIFTDSLGRVFFRIGLYENMVTDFTAEGTKILPQKNKNEFQYIVHVFPKGDILIKEEEVLSVLSPPYSNAVFFRKSPYTENYISYGSKFFFTQEKEMRVYENEEVKVINEADFNFLTSITKISSNEVIIQSDGRSLYYLNLDTIKLIKIYEGKSWSLPQFIGKDGDEYLYYINNQPDHHNKVFSFNISKFTTKMIWTYDTWKSIGLLSYFPKPVVWVSTESNGITSYWMYQNGIIKAIENKEIDIIQPNQELNISFNQQKNELSILDLSYGSGNTVIDIPDAFMVSDPQKVNGYYTFITAEAISDKNSFFKYSLWRTDGSKKNTFRLVDNLRNYYMSKATASKLYFTVTEEKTGAEVWETDGTIEGTKLIADVWKGTFSSFPENLIVIGDFVYCFATTPSTGKQLWRIAEINDKKILSNENNMNEPILTVFPNPTSDIIAIKSDVINKGRVEVFDIKGMCVLQAELSEEKTISLESLPSGIYYTRITTKDKKYGFKIIKR